MILLTTYSFLTTFLPPFLFLFYTLPPPLVKKTPCLCQLPVPSGSRECWLLLWRPWVTRNEIGHCPTGQPWAQLWGQKWFWQGGSLSSVGQASELETSQPQHGREQLMDLPCIKPCPLKTNIPAQGLCACVSSPLLRDRNLLSSPAGKLWAQEKPGDTSLFMANSWRPHCQLLLCSGITHFLVRICQSHSQVSGEDVSISDLGHPSGEPLALFLVFTTPCAPHSTADLCKMQKTLFAFSHFPLPVFTFLEQTWWR